MHIKQIVDQIAALEAELQKELEAQEERLYYRAKDRSIVFEKSIEAAHQRVKQGIFRWLLTVRPQNFLTMPVIYGMAIPLLLFDLLLTLYQLVCFPVYRIARVKHADHIVIDHQHLAYLNLIEKAHCLYCSYAVGMLSYGTEIVARTEQYFCPIKHAGKMRGAHARYSKFLEYGEAANFREKIETLRAELAEEIDHRDKNT